MKKILAILASFMFAIMLSGCGSAGGASSVDMGTSDQLPVGDLMSMGGGDGMSLDGSMNIDSLMGGLTGGGSDDDDDDDDSDDDSSSDDSGDSTTNTGAPKYTTLGAVTITFDGEEYPLQAIASHDEALVPTAYVIDANSTHVMIQIAAYDVREDRLNLDTGSLVFTFSMPIIQDGDQRYLESGVYPLLTPDAKSGDVTITEVRDFNNDIYLTGNVEHAELYSSDKENTFDISIDFKVKVSALQMQ
jgi:hypothetical protein